MFSTLVHVYVCDMTSEGLTILSLVLSGWSMLSELGRGQLMILVLASRAVGGNSVFVYTCPESSASWIGFLHVATHATLYPFRQLFLLVKMSIFYYSFCFFTSQGTFFAKTFKLFIVLVGSVLTRR